MLYIIKETIKEEFTETRPRSLNNTHSNYMDSMLFDSTSNGDMTMLMVLIVRPATKDMRPHMLAMQFDSCVERIHTIGLDFGMLAMHVDRFRSVLDGLRRALVLEPVLLV